MVSRTVDRAMIFSVLKSRPNWILRTDLRNMQFDYHSQTKTKLRPANRFEHPFVPTRGHAKCHALTLNG